MPKLEVYITFLFTVSLMNCDANKSSESAACNSKSSVKGIVGSTLMSI